jgi:HSP20 family protein
VSLRAEVKRESEEKDGEKTIYSERSYGFVSRSFRLPAEVDEAAVSAGYKNGVLHLTLPKKAGGAARRVAVS